MIMMGPKKITQGKLSFKVASRYLMFKNLTNCHLNLAYKFRNGLDRFKMAAAQT